MVAAEVKTVVNPSRQVATVTVLMMMMMVCFYDMFVVVVVVAKKGAVAAAAVGTYSELKFSTRLRITEGS